MQNRSSSSGFSYTINPVSLYQNGPLSIKLDSGQIDMNPNWFFDFDFDDSGINKFEMSTQNGTINGNFQATVTASQTVSLPEQQFSLLSNPYKKTYTKYIPALLFGIPVIVPITVVLQIDVIANYNTSISAAISRTATFSSTNTFNLGIKYDGSQWQGINNFNSTNIFNLSSRTGNANATINLSLTPKVSVKLYGQAGPYASIALKEQLSGSVASPALDWDFKADVWLKSTVGASVAILDYTLADYNKSWETDKISYLTPYKIERVSGNNQLGTFGEQLTNPIKIRVLDNLNRIQSNVPVYFTIVAGGGKVQTANILTDSNGFAETRWTLGTSGEQIVDVFAKRADGTALLNSPVSFAAITSPCEDISASYPIVTIGSQVWMQKNLNVCKYRNGDDIPEVTDPTQWANLKTGAWCYYNNDPANGPIYGKLYNWYAVNDSRGLAPVGYHVPSDGELTTLTTFLGGEMLAGGRMKTATGWDAPNTSATNSSEFSGLPGGHRFSYGPFVSVGKNCFLWSSSEYNTLNDAWYRYLSSTNGTAYRTTTLKVTGFSVRCLRD